MFSEKRINEIEHHQNAHLTEEDVDRICDIIKDCRGAIN